MTNLDVADMTKKDVFFAAYEKAKAAKTEKQAINTAPIRIDEQVVKFGKNSFSKKDEQALYKDAISV
jgi:hypothetical protein